MANQGAEGLLSPFLRARRFAAARPFLYGVILDVGCGTGEISKFIAPANYWGVEQDKESLHLAHSYHPENHFSRVLPTIEYKFDTIIALAVIEHVKDPVDFLCNLKLRLKDDTTSRIVITTPHPYIEIIHTLGAKIGLFSAHGAEEHETLLGRSALVKYGNAANLQVVHFSRFLFFANQLCVYSHASVNNVTL